MILTVLLLYILSFCGNLKLIVDRLVKTCYCNLQHTYSQNLLSALILYVHCFQHKEASNIAP